MDFPHASPCPTHFCPHYSSSFPLCLHMRLTLLLIHDSDRLSLQFSLPMAMLGHGIDEFDCNSAGITLITDDETFILCF